MVLQPIACPSCHETDVVKHGQTADGKQRFFCQNLLCTRQTFLLEYVYQGRLPDVKQQIVDMTMNGSGIRDIARVLHISPTTVIETLKTRTRNSSSESCGLVSVTFRDIPCGRRES
jgi:insertion element IS1 protein InsB